MCKKYLVGVLGAILIFGIVFLGTWITMLLFNWVMGLFGFAFTITFWQMFGVCVLLNLIGYFFK